jgi:hypothetical protein
MAQVEAVGVEQQDGGAHAGSSASRPRASLSRVADRLAPEATISST